MPGAKKRIRLLHFGISLAVCIAAVAQIVVGLTQILQNYVLVDLFVNYQAAAAYLRGLNPYDMLHFNVPFNSPPAALIFYAFFTIFPFELSQILYIIFAFCAFFGSFYVLKKIVPNKLNWTYFFFICAFLLQTFPTKFSLAMGQVNIFVLFFLVLSFYYFQNKKHLLSAFLLALSAGLKITPLGLLLLFIAKKEYRYVLLTIGFFLLLNAALLPLFLDWAIRVFPGLTGASAPQNFYDQSLFTFFLRLTGNLIIARVLFIASFATLAALVLKKTNERSLHLAYFSLLALLSVSGSFSWQHHLVLALPLFFYLVKKPFVFLLFWTSFAFHFLSPAHPLLANPLVMSYQTIIVVLMILYVNFMKNKAVV